MNIFYSTAKEDFETSFFIRQKIILKKHISEKKKLRSNFLPNLEKIYSLLIKKIIYSPENIKISLFYEQNPKNFRETKSPVANSFAVCDGEKLPDTKRKNSVFSQNFQFVSKYAAAGLGFEPRFNAPGAFGLPLADPAI